MFKYRIKCDKKERAMDAVQQMIRNDFPCGKNLFGGKAYRAGIHFMECDETIKGFFLDASENEVSRGGPIRVYFSGKFAEENGEVFFDVCIYPSIPETILLIFGGIQFTVFGKSVGFIISILLLLFFGTEYYKMIVTAHDTLKRIME